MLGLFPMFCEYWYCWGFPSTSGSCRAATHLRQRRTIAPRFCITETGNVPRPRGWTAALSGTGVDENLAGAEFPRKHKASSFHFISLFVNAIICSITILSVLLSWSQGVWPKLVNTYSLKSRPCDRYRALLPPKPASLNGASP